MNLVEAGLLLLAAVGAGAMNAVIGAGTLITFPALLALGYPPVVANVSNTVGLVPGAITGAFAYRFTLRGRWDIVRKLVVVSALGGLAGGTLLLALPSRAFNLVVPPLLLLSAMLVVLQPRVAAAVVRRRERLALSRHSRSPGHESVPAPPVQVEPLLITGIAATGVYGGYFGAAQGVILLALLSVFIKGGMNQVNGIKNVLAGIANLVSAMLFIAVANVNWNVAALVALGATIGGGLGGRYGRELPELPLRVLVATVAVLAASWRLFAA